jgi:hypothetical protein
MFRDKAFNISFVISLFWHLVWMSIVTIIVMPAGFKAADYSNIYFLGPVFEETAYDLMIEASPVRFETMYTRPFMPQYVLEVDIDESIGRYPQPGLDITASSLYEFSLRDIIREDKITVPYLFRKTSVVSGDLEAKSVLGQRALIFKPEEIPKVPIWVTQEKESFKIELEFIVSPEGVVGEITPVVSSGYPNVDIIGMDYLKKWRFAPLTEAEEQKEETGRIELELKVD